MSDESGFNPQTVTHPTVGKVFRLVEKPKYKSKPQNIFICLDGTWNEDRHEGLGSLSNVRKLYEMLGPDTDTQIRRYFRGVGNAQSNNGILRRIRGFNGADEEFIRNEAWLTLLKEYQKGDRIFIFGFSRGAACARRLAAQIHDKGLPAEIDVTYEYRTNRMTRQVEAVPVKWNVKSDPPVRMDVEVFFLGCWDTVGAFVLPHNAFADLKFLNKMSGHWVRLRERWRGNVPFENQILGNHIKHAVHCVALDETRNAFLPVLMEQKPDVVEEVWFPGVHADVGGAYHEDVLGRISLRFMLTRMQKAMKKSNLIPIQIQFSKAREFLDIPNDPDFVFHFHGFGGLRRPFRSIRRILVRGGGSTNSGIPKIHASVEDIWKTDNVFAVQGKSKWRIVYTPFNLKALKGEAIKQTGTASQNVENTKNPFTLVSANPNPLKKGKICV